MADSIKISELPELAGVDPDDIVPVVDKTLSQTSRVTAGDIAALGGGPPGDGTVTTASIVDGAVTAAKVNFITPFAFTLLDDQNQAEALATLGFSGPTFTAPVKVAAGSAGAPSYTFSGDEDTGIFRQAANTIGFAVGGVEVLRIEPNGRILTVIPNTTTFLPSFGIRAWVTFDGTTATPTIKASGNIAGVARGALPVGNPQGNTGQYEITFLTPMPDTNYAIVAFARDVQTGTAANDADHSAANLAAVNWDSPKTTTGCKVISCWPPFQTRYDTTEYTVLIVR